MALPPSLGSFGAGARGPGSLGLAPVVATASFPLINLPNFYLSFTILVSLILVKYPDRVGLVNTVGTYSTMVPLVPACTGRPKYYYRAHSSETIRTEVGKGRTAAAAHESAARLSIPF